MNTRHKKVQVVTVHNDLKAILLLEMKEDRGFGWQNVTGSVDPGEGILDAAKRELLEETSIDNAEIIEIDQTFEFHDRWSKDVTEYCFLARTSQNEIVISPQEHQGYKWVPLNQVTKKDFKYESNFIAFQKALECLD
ncbi:dihydroneopterin triphosphate pyrophosphatase family protein [Bacteriovorax sp. BAL6_X]|uniref:NUDIX domain-containing protein n=1 Tax=Bacteriovorax sp. BAL6_X TaxID=1201290 RepID=UPI000385A420|nr:NUDIX domain-containing protein [Bacteriovorax sp. BAL6_X]EPZ50106.1 dihydroneopterin triphosphate pyrophosphatase family protein [Bacteriovorax sp. BAL6_X]